MASQSSPQQAPQVLPPAIEGLDKATLLRPARGPAQLLKTITPRACGVAAQLTSGTYAAVQLLGTYLADIADKGQPQGCQFLDEAYPQQPISAAHCLNSPMSVDEADEGLARLHNG